MKTTPIWLVVGFLGAGKTTVLRQLVHHVDGQRLLFIVNEFSSVDVDAHRVECEGGTVLAVAGGSIFCHCRITEFISALTQVAEGIPMRTGEILHPRGVVIEASGMADPRSMGRLLHESGLGTRFHVASITAIVDPATFSKLLCVLPNIRGQLESADLILLNKTDLHSTEAIAELRRTVSNLNSTATIACCTYGDIAPDLILSDDRMTHIEQVDADFGGCRDPHFERELLSFRKPIHAEDLRACFAHVDAGLYRAKGSLLTTEGWYSLDWSAGRLTFAPCPPAATSSLVLIYSPKTCNTLISDLCNQGASRI